jgi:bile acid:Na+ symporter, BASS family
MNLQQYLGLALQVSIALTVLGLGLTASWKDATYLLRQPGLLVRSVLAMSVVMPVVAVAFAKLFNFPIEVEAALVALSLAPVPPLLYKKQLGAGGRREYVVGLLVAMGLLSVVLVPLSVEILNTIFSTSLLVSPMAIGKIILTSVLGPLAVGLTVRQLFRAAEKAASHIIALGGLLLVVGAVVLLYGLWPVTRTFLGDGVALMLAAFVLVGLCVGHLLGGPVPVDRTTLAISTAQRHPAVALAIASATGTSKQSELAVILLYLIIATIVIVPYKKWRMRAAAAA